MLGTEFAGADFVRGRVCQGPSLLGAEMSSSPYNTAKRTSNRAVHQARSEAEKVALQKIDPRSGDVYQLAKQMRRDNQDVMGEKPVKNDAGQLSLDEEAKERSLERAL